MTVKRRSRLVLAAGALLATSVLAAGAAEGAVLGKTSRTPEPACPKGDCQAVGSMTAIQLTAAGRQAPFKARKDGKLVAWAVDLSRPTKSQQEFFGSFYESNGPLGTSPAARIAVLKRKGNGPNYKLKAQSPVVELRSLMGSYQVITLGDPLRIRKGEFLGITVPTWAPLFAVGLNGPRNVWRASRESGACSPQETQDGKPQQNVGSVREYGCDYTGARLLYWGFYQPKRSGGGGGGE